MFSSTFCKQFSLKAGIVTLLSLTSLFNANPSSAAVINGGFEQGFNNWETFGSTSIETAEYGIKPPEGIQQAKLDTFCPPQVNSNCKEDGNYMELAQFLDLEMNDLDALGNGEVYEGSAIKTTLTVEAGDVLTFDWNFLTQDRNANGFNDFAFAAISLTLQELADTFSTVPVSFVELTEFSNQTGYKTFTHTFTTAGTFNLGIGVADVTDGSADSALLVDNVSISRSGGSTTVPEPTSLLGFLAVGAFGVGSRLLRKN
jgi:plastocyanin